MKTTSLITITINGKPVTKSRNLMTNKGIEAILAGNFASHRFRFMLTQLSPSILDADELPEAVYTATPSRTVTIEKDDIDKTYARVRARYYHSFTATSEIAFNALALTTSTGIAHAHARITDMLGRPALITVLEGEQVTITYDVFLNAGYDTPVNIQLDGQFQQATRNVGTTGTSLKSLTILDSSGAIITVNVENTFDPATRRSRSLVTLGALQGNSGAITGIRLGFLEYILATPITKTKYETLTFTVEIDWS